MENAGTILLGLSFDEAQNSLSVDAKQAMLDILGLDLTSLVYRGKFVFVAQVGNRQKTIFELRDDAMPDGVGMDVLIIGKPT